MLFFITFFKYFLAKMPSIYSKLKPTKKCDILYVNYTKHNTKISYKSFEEKNCIVFQIETTNLDKNGDPIIETARMDAYVCYKNSSGRLHVQCNTPKCRARLQISIQEPLSFEEIPGKKWQYQWAPCIIFAIFCVILTTPCIKKLR